MLNQTTENPNVQKAVTIIRELSADDKIREEARKREEALITEKWVLSAAKKEGRAEGMAEGIARGRAEAIDDLANALKEMGISEDCLRAALLKAQGITPSSEYENEDDEWDCER